MPRENRPSILLSKEENDIIFKLIGSTCESLATAVVQLFTTEGPAHNQWIKRETGILCLIKDHQKRSYFFRIYCLHRKMLIWEHEVYNQIEYKSPRAFLHTFEAEEYMTAFNFANEDEASVLKTHLIEKIELRKQKREERQRQRSSMQMARNSSGSSVVPNSISPAHHHHHHHHRQHNGNAIHQTPQPVPPTPVQSQKSYTQGYVSKSASKKPKSRKLTKADIGHPQDFKHVSHVGWDANRGFDLDNLSEQDMKDFFYKAGVSDSQLRDKDTRDFIYDFIKRNGGLDAVKEDLVDPVSSPDGASPPPTLITPKFGSAKGNNYNRAPLPPPVPARGPVGMPSPQISSQPSSGARIAPPPPPPPTRLFPPPPPVPAAAPPSPPAAPPHRSVPPRPPPVQMAAAAPPPAPPPPPPPPPPADAAPPPPPPQPSPAAPSQPDSRAELMDSIRNRSKTLKHVEVARKSSDDDKRGNLLSEIRQGVELRSVTTNSSEDRKSDIEPSGLAGALARALQERSKAIHSSDSSDNSDGDSTSDGDEWED